jgi:ABC-type transport system involved in multi-copper enzyme maturation permease subunit
MSVALTAGETGTAPILQGARPGFTLKGTAESAVGRVPGTLRTISLIAWSVLIEAVRRREVYAIVLITLLLIGGVMAVDFFKIEGLSKFYREIALQAMSHATALTVILLAARQLPREFETRTIYPLLAKPISRTGFLLGKVLGVLGAAAFTTALFLAVFIGGSLYLGSTLPWMLVFQHIVLQLQMFLIICSLCIWLSMVVNVDAAITLGTLFYFLSSVMTRSISFLYDYAETGFEKYGLITLHWILPHVSLFDLSEKITHSEAWGPVGWWAIGILSAYAAGFSLLFLGAGLWCFRRRAL